MEKIKYNIFTDLDGVIADFETGFDARFPDVTLANIDKDVLEEYKKDFAQIRFFRYLPLYDRAKELVQTIIDLGHTPKFLTAVGKYHPYENSLQKRLWIEEHFGTGIDFHYVERSHQKVRFASPCSLLIDGREKSIAPWRETGNKYIKHTSIEDTIEQLKSL